MLIQIVLTNSNHIIIVDISNTNYLNILPILILQYTGTPKRNREMQETKYGL